MIKIVAHWITSICANTILLLNSQVDQLHQLQHALEQNHNHSCESKHANEGAEKKILENLPFKCWLCSSSLFTQPLGFGHSSLELLFKCYSSNSKPIFSESKRSSDCRLHYHARAGPKLSLS